MVRKIFTALAAALMLSVMSLPAFATDENTATASTNANTSTSAETNASANHLFTAVRQTVAFVASVDAPNKKVVLRHRMGPQGQKTLDVSTALLVTVENGTAKVATIEDLKEGDPLRVWFTAAKDSKEMKGVLVVRVKQPMTAKAADKAQKFLSKAKKFALKSERFLK